MSDDFWRRVRERQDGGFLYDEPAVDEGTYHAWYLMPYSSGTAPQLELVPVFAEDPEVWYIGALQTINCKYNRETGEVCLMVPSAGMIFFLEGRGLHELVPLIGERKVRSVHAFDPALHRPIGNDAVVVTAIRAEQS